MKNKRWVPKVGEVVKYLRSGEVLYRYGRVHATERLLLCADGEFRTGLRVIDGNGFFVVNADQFCPLTKRERGSR